MNAGRLAQTAQRLDNQIAGRALMLHAVTVDRSREREELARSTVGAFRLRHMAALIAEEVTRGREHLQIALRGVQSFLGKHGLGIEDEFGRALLAGFRRGRRGRVHRVHRFPPHLDIPPFALTAPGPARIPGIFNLDECLTFDTKPSRNGRANGRGNGRIRLGFHRATPLKKSRLATVW